MSEVRFGQVVLGPPGSGKTTYCVAMKDLLKHLGRETHIINLDPANASTPYEASVSLSELVTSEEVMTSRGLGPNGALIFCLELLRTNVDWLLKRIKALPPRHYLIFDFPGQAELTTHHTMVRDLMRSLQEADIRLCSLYLVDAHYANDPGKYMSALLLTLNTMVQLECPAVNALSKVDTVEKYGKLRFGLDYYAEVLDLDYLVDELDRGPITKKYHKLNKAIADVVTDYSLVSFIPLAVEDKSTLINVLKAVDKANGYGFGSGTDERTMQQLLSVAAGAEADHGGVGAARDEYSEQAEEDDEVLRMIATQNVGRETS